MLATLFGLILLVVSCTYEAIGALLGGGQRSSPALLALGVALVVGGQLERLRAELRARRVEPAAPTPRRVDPNTVTPPPRSR